MQKDREFFHLVNRAIFVNPFSDERIDLDKKIVQLSDNRHSKDRVDRITQEVVNKIEAMKRGGKLTIGDFANDDKLLKLISDALIERAHF